MNFFTKNRILVGAVILLAAINLAIIGTIGFRFLKPTEIPAGPPMRGNHMQFISRELKLTQEQEIQFEELRNEYSEQNQILRKELRDRHHLIVKELSSPEPNREFMDSIANEIAELHFEQQQATIDHFMKLREICSYEQYEQLQHLFRRMMNRDQMKQRDMMPRRNRFGRSRLKDTTE
ncbi:MAG: hypothetical protein CVT98_05180 [Bacteroidetes bacterium HGW-Bacteroidetes-15]|nr:MAG: hypothetical protein CVT98_05180 [Bacteroidetes bacterium HGW-Bacteroidetes-15]